MGAAADLVDLSDHAWGRLQARLVGLGDEDLSWAPGDGVSTMAWRMAHITSMLTEDRIAAWLGADPAPVAPAAAAAADVGEPTTAAGAVAGLEAAYGHWRRVLTSLSDDDLWTPIGPAAGPFGAADRASFVLHVLDELIHHGAELALLRDLHRAQMP